MSRILVVEDNPTIADGLRVNLEMEGYVVEIAGDGESGLERARAWEPHLIILDLMLPGIDGIRVLRTLRGEELSMPVLVLSARDAEVEKVRGFRVGADDFVTKPFGIMELLARVDALLRRGRSSAAPAHRAPSIVRFGNVEVNAATHVVSKKGATVALRPKEFELLAALIDQMDEVVSRSDLLDRVWGYQTSVVTRTVDTHIMELRRKLEDDPALPQHILTVRKAGYRLRADKAESRPEV